MKYLPYILAIIATYLAFVFINLDFLFWLKDDRAGRAGYLVINFLTCALVSCFKQLNKKDNHLW